MPPASSPLSLVLRVDFPGGIRLGRGKRQLLELIESTGSISAAGRAMNMSYRRAWMLVDEINRMFDQPTVESQRGGSHGGGARLTPFGADLLACCRRIDAAARAAVAADLAWLDGHRAPEGRAPEGVPPTEPGIATEAADDKMA